jgi:predicted enzyme related to lactoylglutathione lyase
MPAGDLYYFTLVVPDVGQARAFYSGLFGWEYENSGPESVHIPNTTPFGGLAGGAAEAGIRLYFTVDDVDTAVARIRELGGEATDTREVDSGWIADCRDDQGVPFSVGKLRPEYQ